MPIQWSRSASGLGSFRNFYYVGAARRMGRLGAFRARWPERLVPLCNGEHSRNALEGELALGFLTKIGARSASPEEKKRNLRPEGLLFCLTSLLTQAGS
jgi:hypothetical protein